MRKRSSYRPREQLKDPLSYVLSGFKPLITARDQITLVQIKNHAAIEAVRQGQATINDVDVLLSAFNVAEALAVLGQGADWKDEIVEAQRALRSAGERSKYRFSGPELSAVNLAMEIHDAQLHDSGTTIALMQKALELVQKALKLKQAVPVRFEVPA